jgi:hypothetical protein
MADSGLGRSRTEARLVTGAGLIVAAAGVSSVVSPDIEGFLNYWVTLTVAVGGGGTLAWIIGRSLWLSAAIEYELRRPLPPQYAVVQVATPAWRDTEGDGPDA